MKAIKLKSLDEIMARFKELVHRHRRRYLKRFLKPCPMNCSLADTVGRRVTGCVTCCGSRDVNVCKRPEKFVPLYTKEELAEQFRQDLRDPQVLLREYRDVVVFLFCLSQFDDETAVPEHIIQEVEKRGE